jgi:hypothetical protein
MNRQNLYLKQISCLASPVRNQDWCEIVQHFPAALICLNKLESYPIPLHSELATATPCKHTERQGIDEPIPWCEISDDAETESDSRPFVLEAFFYDCSYLSPFVGNVYARERSENGWYRWVGPSPTLEIRLPLALVSTESWLLKVAFHAFHDDSHSQHICFEVNGNSKKLEWVEKSVYQSRIMSNELYLNTTPGKTNVVSMKISVPEAKQASEDDQRLLSFAIREITLFPA